MKKIKEMLLSNTISSLTANELKNTFGGTVPLEDADDGVNGTQYCKWTCIAGNSIGTSGSTPQAYTNAVATNACGAGNFSKVC